MKRYRSYSHSADGVSTNFLKPCMLDQHQKNVSFFFSPFTPKLLSTFAETIIHQRGVVTKFFWKRIAKTDCEFMISRCEKHSQAVETPSIYCGPWIKLTTAFPWFMMRLCWNAMPFTTVCFYLYICCTRPLQLLIQTWCAFYTTHSIFPVNSCVSLLH